MDYSDGGAGLLGTGCLFNKTGEDLNSLVGNDSVASEIFEEAQN